jgi:glycosyltransferase involved in cell wall biosynthesis
VSARRIALVVYGDPHRLPPTLNAAHVLAARGWDVDLIGIRWRDRVSLDDGYPENVRRLIFGESGPGISHYWRWLRFTAWAISLAHRNRYHWIYAYDAMAAPIGAAMARAAGARWVYHSHDLVAAPTRAQRWLRLAALERRAVRDATLVVLPQRERALRFAAEARLATAPLVAHNSPPRDWADGAELDPRVDAFRRRWPRLVVYQGGLSRARGVGTLLDSLAGWPADAGLVLVGDAATADARAVLRDDPRVLVLGPLAYRALPSVTRAAALGVFVPRADADDLNLHLIAGASNKVFEYFACGLPVLVRDDDGFRALVGDARRGSLCSDDSPRALASQIAGILDDTERAAIGARNRRAFLDELCYERQLAPVLARLDAE